MSDLIEPRKLKGFRDYGPEQALMRKRIIDSVWETALVSGFQPIITPALEYADTLVGSGGGDTDKEVYRFVDHGNRDVALRFDLTVPFARFVAENQGTLILPFKKVQIGDVWRGEKPQKGRYREFCQADLDIVGVDSLAADVEVIGCLGAVLAKFENMRFTVALGNRVLLSALIKKTLGHPGETHEAAVIVMIDKLAKVGADGVRNMLVQLPGVDLKSAHALIQAVTAVDARGESDLAVVREIVGEGQREAQEIVRYGATCELLRSLVRPNITYRADLALARGLGYYTGIVFEATIDGLAGFGSVSGGGRYNRLVSRFSSQELPGVGGSIGVDRFLAAIEESGQLGSERSARHAYVAVATEDARAYAVGIADELRRAGLTADIALKPGKLGNQFRHADKLGYGLVVTVGSDELERQEIAVKVMATGVEDKGIPRSGLVAAVRARVVSD